MENEKSCGALVYCIQDSALQLLLIKHKQGGHWSFPKGHVEENETEIQTAIREVKEETGVSIQILDGFRQQVNYSPRFGVRKDVVYFLGFTEDKTTQRQESEISELSWVSLNNAQHYLTYENDKMLLDSAKEYFARQGNVKPQR